MVDTLHRLAATIAERRRADAGSSYTASLFARGLPKIAQKLGEEAVETVIAAMARDPKGVTGEAADLLFHLLVLLEASDVPLADVLAELDRREGVSGLDEKASRPADIAMTVAPATPEAPAPRPLGATPPAPEPTPGLAMGGPAPATRRRIRRG
jgi:phosphoribosyl-ATP pyrophosphohydrolase